MSSRLLWLPCLALLAACTNAGDHSALEFPLSGAWQSITGEDRPVEAAPAAVRQAEWWKRLNDDTLNGLVAQALEKNHELKAAQASVLEARAARRGAFAIMLPEVTGSASAVRSKSGGFNGGTPETSYDAGFDASWEIDLFGRRQNELAAARAGVEAAEANVENATLTLLAELARNYVQARSLQKQRALTARNIETQERTLEIVRLQYEVGSVSRVDVARAEAQLQTSRALLPQVDTALAAALGRLNTLTGAPPGTVDFLLAEAAPVPVAPERVVVAAPASVVAQRPDIRASERNLARAASLSDAAFATLFPNISLSSFLGVGYSSRFGNSSPWSVGANLLAPIFSFGTLQAQIDATDARQTQAFHGYQQTVLAALEEVENRLTAYTNERTRLNALTSAAVQARVAAELAKMQYEAGSIALLDLLIAERAQLDAETAQTQSEEAVTTALVALYKAVGGAWDVPPEVPETSLPVEMTPAPPEPSPVPEEVRPLLEQTPAPVEVPAPEAPPERMQAPDSRV